MKQHDRAKLLATVIEVDRAIRKNQLALQSALALCELSGESLDGILLDLATMITDLES